MKAPVPIALRLPSTRNLILSNAVLREVIAKGREAASPGMFIVFSARLQSKIEKADSTPLALVKVFRSFGGMQSRQPIARNTSISDSYRSRSFIGIEPAV
jgi:hypothetical protein